MWTALPNGFIRNRDGSQTLKLSAFLTPRLESTALTGAFNLSDFPDFESVVVGGASANWTDIINGMQFDVETYHATSPATKTRYAATKMTPAADSALWEQCFGPEMPYKTFKFRDFSVTKVKSFSLSSVVAPIKRQYQAVAATPWAAYKLPTVAKLVSVPALTTLPMVNVLPTSIQQMSGMSALAAAPARNASYSAFEEFHQPYTVPADFVAPPIPAIDFHKGVSAMGNYPALLRRLGLVVDLEVTFTSKMAGARRIRVIPKYTDGRLLTSVVANPTNGDTLTRKNSCQWTELEFAVTSYLPTRILSFRPKSQDGHVKNGYLVARSITNPAADATRLFNFDVDTAASVFIGTSFTAANLINEVSNPVVNQSLGEGEEGVAASAVTSSAQTQQMGLPSLGQPVIRMSVAGMAARLEKRFQRSKAINTALLAELEETQPLYAEDLVRGYRIDAWDSATRQWHRLCGRVGEYAIGDTPITWDGAAATYADEGWVQMAGVSAPGDVLTEEPPSEMRIHESVFDWSGWSLAVPRPGVPLSEPDASGMSTPSKTFQDPDGVTTESGHFLHPDLPLDVRFTVPPGDLPRLRFGTTYRFRARMVDLAGNSVAFSEGDVAKDPGGTGDSDPTVTRALVHKRYDPVKPPTIVPVDGPKPSETAHVVVVRSYHDPITHAVITEDSARHITPPRIPVTMAEAEGGLDDGATPGRPLDPAMWVELKTRDAYNPPQLADGSAAPQASVPTPAPYLPDRYARGVALKGLPGVASATTLTTLGTSARVSGVKVPLSATKTTTVSAMRVSFEKAGLPWYQRLPLKVFVKGIEATDARLPVHASPKLPAWNETDRLLSLQLPKADEYTVKVSSYLNAADLKVMGIHQWSMEKFVPSLATVKTPAVAGLTALASAPATNLAPTATSASLPTNANAMINVSTIGQNWMLTPAQDVKLVHAVDQPMIKPAFTSRAHMERKPGETHATLVDWMPIHGKSTAKLDVTAAWNQNVDDPAKGMPLWGATAVPKKAAVFGLTIPRGQTTILNCGRALPAMVSSAWGVVPKTGMLVNTSGVDTKPQRFHLGDTKHHLIRYRAKYASRYDTFFPDIDGLTFDFESAEKSLHVPSSARPAAPSIAYIIPTFGWSTSTVGNVAAKTRKGGGLRVYLERPWFSSGESERLAVVLYQPRPYSAGWTQLQPLVTQWGNDPLWKSLGSLPTPRPALSDFIGEATNKTGLKLREYSGSSVMIAAYDVDYDPELDMWFADIVINQGKAYWPFVKLALARYQQYSLTNYELSAVRVADFVQLTPDRYASVTLSSDGYTLRATLTGNTYSDSFAKKSARVTVQLEKRLADDDATIGWTPLISETAMAMLARTTQQVLTGDTRRTWAATTKLTENVDGTTYRAVIREYEQYKKYTNGTVGYAERLVYADAVTITT